MDRKLIAKELVKFAKALVSGRINSKQGMAYANVNEAHDKVNVEIVIEETYQPGLFDGDPKAIVKQAMNAAEEAFIAEMRKHYDE